jgi:hypothetical protein
VLFLRKRFRYELEDVVKQEFLLTAFVLDMCCTSILSKPITAKSASSWAREHFKKKHIPRIVLRWYARLPARE